MARGFRQDNVRFLLLMKRIILIICIVPLYILSQAIIACASSPSEKYAPSFEANIVHPSYLEEGSVKEKKFSSPLTLEDLIDAALSSHPSLRLSWARVKESASTVGQALSFYYPHVSSNIFANYNDESMYQGSDVWEDTTKMGASLELTYLLLDNGGRENTAGAAKKQLDAANFTYNQAVLDVVLDVQQQYYAYAKSLQMLAAKKEDLRVARFNRDLAKDFFSAGLNSKSAELQAQAHVSQMTYQLASIKSEVRKNWSNLACLCGLPTSPQLDVETPARLDQDLVSRNAEELIKMVENKNPGLQSLESRIQSEEHRVQAAESRFWPTLSLVGSGTAQKVKADGRRKASVEDNEYLAAVGFKITYDLFTGFSDSYDTRQARTRVKAVREEYAKNQLELKQQVEQALNEYQASVDKLKAGKAYIQDAKTSYQVAVDFFKDGEGAMVEITRALEQLANAKSEVVAARMGMYTAAASLAHSCGAFEKMGAERAEWRSLD